MNGPLRKRHRLAAIALLVLGPALAAAGWLTRPTPLPVVAPMEEARRDSSDATVPSNPDAAVPSNPDAAVPSNPDAAVPSNADAAVPSNPDAAVPSNPDAAVHSNAEAK